MRTLAERLLSTQRGHYGFIQIPPDFRERQMNLHDSRRCASVPLVPRESKSQGRENGCAEHFEAIRLSASRARGHI